MSKIVILSLAYPEQTMTPILFTILVSHDPIALLAAVKQPSIASPAPFFSFVAADTPRERLKRLEFTAAESLLRWPREFDDNGFVDCSGDCESVLRWRWKRGSFCQLQPGVTDCSPRVVSIEFKLWQRMDTIVAATESFVGWQIDSSVDLVGFYRAPSPVDRLVRNEYSIAATNVVWPGRIPIGESASKTIHFRGFQDFEGSITGISGAFVGYQPSDPETQRKLDALFDAGRILANPWPNLRYVRSEAPDSSPGGAIEFALTMNSFDAAELSVEFLPILTRSNMRSGMGSALLKGR